MNYPVLSIIGSLLFTWLLILSFQVKSLRDDLTQTDRVSKEQMQIIAIQAKNTKMIITLLNTLIPEKKEQPTTWPQQDK